MIYYISIGIFIMFLIEHSTQKHKRDLEYEGMEVPTFNWFDRLFNILLWPLTLILFIKNLKDLL